jgi:hypothetical protein
MLDSVFQRRRSGLVRDRIVRLRSLGRGHALVLALLAGQFALIQLATGMMHGDAPRNLHWGLLTVEQPRFLLDAPDLYERIKGFPPDPLSLASRDLYRNPPGALHPWWGPVAPLLWAAVWSATRSYTLLQLVIPLAAAGVVLLTYGLARDIYGRQRALIAAAFLACFPLFLDYAITSYSETLSALVLTGALLAFWRRRTVLAVLLGGLAAWSKMDLLLLYTGVVGACLLAMWWRREWTLGRWHTLIAFGAPVLLGLPWLWLHYLGGAPGGQRGLSLSLFTIILPQMLELLFYIPWYGALIALAAVAAGIVAALRAPIAPLTRVFLGSWLGLGLLVTLVYAATPGAGNSPRILIPALPAAAVLFAAGLPRLAVRWRRRIGFFLVVLFFAVDLILIGYAAYQGSIVRSYGPAWEVLRDQPRGFVLTDRYWEAILYARQPATWFEGDEVFQRNIMHNQEHFARYVTQNPIRYVVLPAEGDLAAPEVRAYLDSHAQPIAAGSYIVYNLR